MRPVNTQVFSLSTALCLLTAALLNARSPEGYYRLPALHGSTVVFCAEGDLWTVDVEGGVARRLTTHPGEESHPAISPDGTRLAFTAAYEGPHEVYVMPLAGGLPTRLTYEGASGRRKPRPVGWTPSGQVLYSSRAYSTLPDQQLVRIDPRTTDATVVPLSQADDGVYDPSGRTLFFTRLPFQGSHAKRYRGGTAQNLWKLTDGAPEAVALTADYPGTSKRPMWWNGRIYFASDRTSPSAPERQHSGHMNVWSMDPDGDGFEQHTTHAGWDVRSPSLSDGRIVYQLGADLRLYDVAAGTDRALEITLASDFDQMRETWLEKPMDYLTAVHLSPSGDRVVLTARGEVFVAPVGGGRFVHVTRRPGVRYRQARFLPDGKSLMALSDESGEVEWWRLPADGVGSPEPLTTDGKVLRYDGTASPDGQWIAGDNHHKELRLVHVADRQTWKIAASPSAGFDGVPSWSPDSRWLAYSMTEINQLNRLYLAAVDERRPVPLTSDRYRSFSPAWSPDGRWIYFLSNRHFRTLVGSPWGERQPDPFFDQKTKVYAVALRESGADRFPFEPYDEFHPAPPEPSRKGGKDAGGPGTAEAGPADVHVDLDGLRERLFEVPVPPGNYSRLSTDGERLFWLRTATSFERERDLLVLDVDPKATGPEVLVENVQGYELSLDGKKLLVRRKKNKQGNDEEIVVVDASTPAPIGGEGPPRKGPRGQSRQGKVDLAKWTFPFDPREEWRQMFVDAWRLHRDYFYDRGMHGIDWPAMREKYLPLVDRVTTRAELSDILGQMISELSALHASVRRGDHRRGPEQVEPSFLGAVLKRDEAAGGYRIEHVYRGDPDLPDELSPLARPGLGIHDGHIVVAVNGVSTLQEPPGALLRNQAGRQVRLRVKPSARGPERSVIVVPIDAERAQDLRYDEWELSRRLRVEEQAEGRVGYVHLRAMGSRNIAEWQREFYPVFHRQGLVVDVRHNPGGNIDSWVLGKLLRRAWMYWQAPSGEPYWNMQQAFRGHMVVLVDERTGSDGEAFAEGFRRLELGPVIGTRTWGGEIWLTSSNVLVDKGIATAAEFGVYGPEGTWLIEGHGVEPDIVVDNPPHATFQGEDAQLDAAVRHLLEKIRQDPRPVPPAPPYPDKSEDG